MTNSRWKLEGYDTFSHEDYALPDEYDTEDAAIAAAKQHLEYLEMTQPSESSGRVYSFSKIKPNGCQS